MAAKNEDNASPVEAERNAAAIDDWENEGGSTSMILAEPDRATETTGARRDVRIRRLRALVADDDEQTLHSVAAAVELLGVDVTCASTGGELVEHLGAEEPFDLIVTDVSMPWMTGLQVMHSVRTAGLRTPVVVMTALRAPSVGTQAAALGEDAVLLFKPFSVADLHAAIRLVLGHPAVAEPLGGTAT